MSADVDDPPAGGPGGTTPARTVFAAGQEVAPTASVLPVRAGTRASAM